MKQILILFLIFCIVPKTFGQVESNLKLKPIPQLKVKTKKEIPPPAEQPESNLPKLNLPKIVTPNVLKETNIFGTKPKVDNSFAIGTAENHFSMIKKNNFEHSIGEVYQSKMTKDLDKTLVREELKEDDRLLVKIDVNFGEIKTKSKYFVIKFRDFGQIDGDLISAFFNGETIIKSIQLEGFYQEFRIYFKEGFNVLKLEALNRGLLGGNTGEFQIYDAEGKFIRSEYWNNWDIGVKGTFVIIKE
jgi:hypothetical protein